MAEKLSKKQRKAQEFKEGKKEKAKPQNTQPADVLGSGEPTSEPADVSSKKRKRSKEVTEEPSSDSPAKKQKQKAKAPPRFILFVGNLPYDLTGEQLEQHFKTANPSGVRMRKGFAFMEFEGDEASKNLHIALRFHHTMLGYRKINVELTAGGGGNSANRRKKLDTKNAALQDELSERIEAEKKQKQAAKDAEEAAEKKEKRIASKEKKKARKEGPKAEDMSGVHPDRLKNFS